MKYIYPAVFTEDDGHFLISFPDFPHVHSEGESLAEAFDLAEDALNLWLWDAEENGDSIPVPSDSESISVPKRSFISLIRADTLEYRKHNDTRAVKKTLTIPRWLDTLAKERNVNFSNLLQNALMNELNVKHG